MKRFFILVEVDVQGYGFNAKSVQMFTDIEKAKEKMREMYLKAFKQYYGDDEDPYAEDNYGYQFGDTYCYVNGYYYLDIFNTDINE